MRYAIIDESTGRVTSVIVATSSFIEHLAAQGMLAINVDEIPCGPGWTFTDEGFVPPTPAPDPTP